MRRVSVLLVLLATACSSSNSDRPQDRPPMRGGGYERARNATPMLLDVLPDDSWWRDPALATPLNLTTDQFQSLEKIFNEQRDEIARLERDLPMASRDFRAAIDADPTSQADITVAAQRVRSIRDTLYDRQVQMLAAERVVLTKQQWLQLVDALQQRQRDEQMNRGDRGYPGGRGGRGGYPRGGRGRPW